MEAKAIEKIVAVSDDSAPTVTFADSVRCPSCRHGLMDPSFPIDGHASVRLTVSFGFEHGWLRLSALRGSRSFACEFDLPGNGDVNFFCPHCSAEIMPPAACGVCNAPLLPTLDDTGFTEQVCSCRAGKKAKTERKPGVRLLVRITPKAQQKI